MNNLKVKPQLFWKPGWETSNVVLAVGEEFDVWEPEYAAYSFSGAVNYFHTPRRFKVTKLITTRHLVVKYKDVKYKKGHKGHAMILGTMKGPITPANWMERFKHINGEYKSYVINE